MQSDYQACEDRVLAHEGSEYTDGVHPYDPGGPTRWGITLADARAFWFPTATANDVRTMPKTVAQQIYKSKYWNAVNGDNLPAGVDDTVFDYGVNSGNSRSGKVLRRVLGMSDTDWHVTDQVVAECKKRDPKAVISAINAERLKFLEGLAIWPTYGRGWTTRVKEVQQYSDQLADHEATPTSTPLPTPPKAPQKGKGKHPPVNTGPIATGGGAATVGAGGLAHYLTGHPEYLLLIIVVGAIAIGVILALLNQRQSAKQDAPTPGVVPVPVTKP